MWPTSLPTVLGVAIGSASQLSSVTFEDDCWVDVGNVALAAFRNRLTLALKPGSLERSFL